MADETFEQLQKNIVSDDVKTAQIAIDYLENDLLEHMETLMDYHLKEWRTRKFVPIYENPTRILIERSAKTYKEPPKRVVTVNGEASEGLTESYTDLLATTNLNFTAQDNDQRSRLTGASMILPQVDKDSGHISLTVLSRNNSDIIFNRLTGEIEGLIYTAGIVGVIDGGEIYHIWTPERIYDLEGGAVVHKEDNPYGFVPVAILHDTRPPLGRLWRYASWEQLVQLSDGVNLFNTEALYNARYAMVGSPVTNMEIPEGTVMGIDSAKSFKSTTGDPAFFEFATPTANVTEFMSWFKPFRETIADEWGVNLNIAGSGTADSGFKLIVEEFENIELRQTRIVAAKQFEQDLYQVFAKMGVIHTEWNLDVNAVVMADFQEPKLPVNKSEEWNIDKEQVALGLLSPEEFWLKYNPDLTKEDLAVKRAAYDKSQGLAGNVPSFDGV